MATDQETSLLPPQPPSTEDEYIENGEFVKGNFDYIKNNSEKKMLQTAYQSINLLELWDFIKEDPGETGFMCSKDKNVYKIYNKIEELGYGGHSGCSFGCIMRDMQSIARYGEKQFRTNYLLTLKKKGIKIL
jgi:hypothetical protein